MLRVLIGLTIATVFVGATAPVAEGPKPAPIPVTWELDIKYENPKRISIQLPGEKTPTVYWYMPYTVTNNGVRTQRFFPIFQLVTEDLRVIDTDMGISPSVFEMIKKRHAKTHRYMVSPTKAIGNIMVGDDHALESVAIWRAGELNVNSFSVFVAGLSGETAAIKNPAYDEDAPETKKITGPNGKTRTVTVNPEYFIIRKTLKLDYKLPGSGKGRAVVKPIFVAKSWIMR